MIVDINVPRAEVLAIAGGCTPAKLVEVINQLNVLEMMMGLAKMRARRTPANQAHVTNRKEHPALLAADAAEAALRGFAEIETTVAVARYAPFNALAILVGSQTGRGGVLTQCAVEEATNLRLGFKGLTSYSETLSVYATERAFVDGDDTPWSKAFLAAAYASRGVKTRFTSGAGAPALMGYAEGKSMLYLEARSLLATRAAGSQGSQNGSISCIALPESLPDGLRAVMAENLIAMLLGLEVASGNDALASHSEIRKAAKLMLQFIPGHRLHHLGLRRDPAPGQHVRRRQLRRRASSTTGTSCSATCGSTAASRRSPRSARSRCARAPRGRCRRCSGRSGFPPITDDEVAAATGAYGSEDMPDRDRVADIEAAQRLLHGPLTVLDVIAALDAGGFADVAANMLEMQRQRVIGDYLQPSAIFDADFRVRSALTDPNDYRGPGTGYRVDGERWAALQDLPQAWEPRTWIAIARGRARGAVAGGGRAGAAGHGRRSGDRRRPGVRRRAHPHDRRPRPPRRAARDCRRAARTRAWRRASCACATPPTAHSSATPGRSSSGSGIAIGVQSKGTTVIHRRGLVPLENLELFAQAPNMDLATYRQIGRNAALHARGLPAAPIPVRSDNTARLRLIVQTTLLHRRETDLVERDRPPVDLRRVDAVPDAGGGR